VLQEEPANNPSRRSANNPNQNEIEDDVNSSFYQKAERRCVSSSRGNTNPKAINPVPEAHKQMNLLEDTLEPDPGQGPFATLALVSTGGNLREWIYYAKSEDAFMARLNYAPAGSSAFPIKIHIAHGPSWKMYEEFTSGLKKQIAN
jgi:hypothetical protein